MLDIRYESSAGVSVALNSGVYVGRPNDLFSREWDYKLGYRALATASRGARKASFKAFFADMAQADALRRAGPALSPAGAKKAPLEAGRKRGERRRRPVETLGNVHRSGEML